MYGNFKSHLANQLNQIYDDGLYKTEREITTPQGSIVNTIELNNLIQHSIKNLVFRLSLLKYELLFYFLSQLIHPQVFRTIFVLHQ